MEVTLYQTVSNENGQSFVEENGPFLCNALNAWLDTGFYFWDTNIQMAHWWGRTAYKNNYMVLGGNAVIDNRCLDLVGNTSHILQFEYLAQLLRESRLHREGDEVLVREVIIMMKEKDLFPFETIRAQDEKKTIKLYFTKERREYMALGTRPQLCLLSKDSLSLHGLKVVHPAK